MEAGPPRTRLQAYAGAHGNEDEPHQEVDDQNDDRLPVEENEQFGARRLRRPSESCVGCKSVGAVRG